MQTIIDVYSTNCFTEQNLKDYNSLVNPNAFPELYGIDLPKELLYSGDYLIQIDDITKSGGVQTFRAGGANKKFPEIDRGIRRNGFKLKYPAISLFITEDGKITVITGNTRLEILKKLNFTNCIASIYKSADGYTLDEVEDAVSGCGIRFNTIHDDASPTGMDDVKVEVEKAISKGWIAPTYNNIRNRVEKNCGNGVFTETTRSRLVFEIYNHYNPSQTIKSWINPSVTKQFVTDKKFINGNGVRYVTYTTQNHAKVFLSIMETAYNYPNDEIRVIVHTGTLEGFDLENCWINRVNAFKDFYQRILLQTSSVYFHSKSPVQNRVKLYGVLPSVSSMHDLDKVVLFDTDGSLYQKIDGEKIPAANPTEKEDEQLAA